MAPDDLVCVDKDHDKLHLFVRKARHRGAIERHVIWIDNYAGLRSIRANEPVSSSYFELNYEHARALVDWLNLHFPVKEA